VLDVLTVDDDRLPRGHVAEQDVLLALEHECRGAGRLIDESGVIERDGATQGAAGEGEPRVVHQEAVGRAQAAAVDAEGLLGVDAADRRGAAGIDDGRPAVDVDHHVVAEAGDAVEVPVTLAAPEVVAGRPGPLNEHGSGAVFKRLKAGPETGTAGGGRRPGRNMEPGETEKASGLCHGVHAFPGKCVVKGVAGAACIDSEGAAQGAENRFGWNHSRSSGNQSRRYNQGIICGGSSWCGRVSPPARPATCTSAASGRRCSTGCSPR